MNNWLLIGATLLLVFVAKCIKELNDVKEMSSMNPNEKEAVLVRRNFYDNHA